jgi:large subunit ribosomal protein L15
LPIIQQLPEKRGFTNIFRREFAIVDLEKLAERFEAGTQVNPEALVQKGILRSTKLPVKILADGEIDRALTVRAHRFSKAAKAKIEAAGGTVEEIG